MSRHFTHLTVGLCIALLAPVVSAGSAESVQNKEQDRLAASGLVIEEILSVPENIPQDVLDRAECVIVIPSMTTVAVGIGGRYGRGAMVCRSGEAFAGAWGAPAMYAIEGGSIGFQIGAEATDLVLMIMNPRGVDALLSSKVTLGGNASVAAGPKGRRVEASTDASMRAEILSYSRSRGLFAGVSLEGTSVRPDDDATEEVYGRRISAREIVTGAGAAVTPAGRALVNALQARSPRNESSVGEP